MAHLEEVLASGGVIDLAFEVLEVSAGAATARERSSAWSSFAREVIRLDQIASYQDATWPTGTLRDVPFALREALTSAIDEIGDTADPTRVVSCRSDFMDLETTERDRSLRLAELMSVAPDRTGLERLLSSAVCLGLEQCGREDLHDPRGPLIAHAIVLGRR